MPILTERDNILPLIRSFTPKYGLSSYKDRFLGQAPLGRNAINGAAVRQARSTAVGSCRVKSRRCRRSPGLDSHRSRLPWLRVGFFKSGMAGSVNKAPTLDRHRRVRCRGQSSSRSSGALGAGRFLGTSGTSPHCGSAIEILHLGSLKPHRSAPSDIG